MKILVLNDDGIQAPGIYALYQAMNQLADDVWVVAPDNERSASGHSITLDRPLRVKKYLFEDGFHGYSVNGTPADCAKLAIRAILDEVPDLVVSGINRGSNLGMSVIYSGTVSAATEGCILGIPSIAFSLTSFEAKDYSAAAYFAQQIVQNIHLKSWPKDVLLNVNIPYLSQDKIKGIRITSQSNSRFIEFFDKRIDPQERDYYWLSGNMMTDETHEEHDDYLIRQSYVSVTPLKLDRTDQINKSFFKNLEDI